MARALPACLCPLGHRHWRALRWDGEAWWLLPHDAARDEQALQRVDVILDLGHSVYLRMRWAGRWRWWPAEAHALLRQSRLPAQWTLLRAGLARQRAWFGDQRA